MFQKIKNWLHKFELIVDSERVKFIHNVNIILCSILYFERKLLGWKRVRTCGEEPELLRKLF